MLNAQSPEKAHGQGLAFEQKELKGAKLLQKGGSPQERGQMYQSKGHINVFMSICLR